MKRIEWMVFTTLTLFLGLFFFFIGLLKVWPHLNRDIHREIRRNFVRYAKVVPVTGWAGLAVSPHHYRLAVGCSEILAGLALALVPGWPKQYATLYLAALMLGAIYTHYAVGDQVAKMTPAFSLLAFLLLRLLMCYQLRSRAKATSGASTATPLPAQHGPGAEWAEPSAKSRARQGARRRRGN